MAEPNHGDLDGFDTTPEVEEIAAAPRAAHLAAHLAMTLVALTELHAGAVLRLRLGGGGVLGESGGNGRQADGCGHQCHNG
ncbi:hypothetical protein D3C72_2283280 [compost metagenome]